jgi:hypothetical protein
MNSFNMTGAIGLMAVVIINAGGASHTSAATDRTGKFEPANSPEETIYQPECRIVQTDGTWLPSRRAECAW